MSDEVQHSPLSHTAGASDVPLLEQTIPDNLDATVARFGDREALVDVQQGIRWTYAEFAGEVERRPRAARRWCGHGRPGGHLGAQLRGVDADAVRDRQDRRRPGQHQPELPHPRARVRPHAGGHLLLVAAAEFKTSNYAQMVEEVRGDCPDLRDVVLIGTASWGALLERAEEVPCEESRAQAGLAPHDPINIQYTSGTTASPRARLSHRNILNNGFFVGELCRYTEEDRVCIPVPFYHCFGMVMGNLACTTHGAAMVIPAAGFDPAATLVAVRDERCTRSTECPPCSSPSGP